MKIQSKQYSQISFAESKTKNDDKTPITKLGERQTLLKSTVAAGLLLGGRLLWNLSTEGFLLDDFEAVSKKIVDKNKKGISGDKKLLAQAGAFAAVTIGFVAAVAAVYTAYRAPNIMYDGKVNAFKKGKDMDVYVKSNNVEKHLYDQMNEKAKDATKEEKEVLSQQYLKLKAAKNPTPDLTNVY